MTIPESFDQYLKTALWSSIVYAAHECSCEGCELWDYENPENNEYDYKHEVCAGNPADDFFGPDDIDSGNISEVADEYADFLAAAKAIIDEHLEPDHIWEDEGQIAHDFWLTRNGHGAGFWDRYPSGTKGDDVGAMLKGLAQTYGSADVWAVDANCFEIH